MFDEPIYALMTYEDMGPVHRLLKDTGVVAKNKRFEIALMVNKPYAAIKIFGPSRLGGLDVTTVMFRPWASKCQCDVSKIERTDMPSKRIAYGTMEGDVTETTKDVYDTHFINVYQKIIGCNF